MIDQLVYCINSYRDAAMSADPKFEHIDLADKQKVMGCLTSILLINLLYRFFLSLGTVLSLLNPKNFSLGTS